MHVEKEKEKEREKERERERKRERGMVGERDRSKHVCTIDACGQKRRALEPGNPLHSHKQYVILDAE